MKKFTSCICSKANGLALRARMALSNQRGDFYISDAVKIIIAVVNFYSIEFIYNRLC